jgi:pimeloyl-ACP methyl ester carboxylesterase
MTKVDATARTGPADTDAVRERAFFFPNADGQHLYGVLHRAAGLTARDVGIVFCHALSEERQCAQRASVDFARFLSHHGYPTLRFDYAGSGDSEGEMADVTISSLLRDVRGAVSRLIGECRVGRVVLVGVRFGALIARMAADTDEHIAGLVLVAPVVCGSDYWASLLRSQQMSCMARGMKSPRLDNLRRTLAESGQLEIKAEIFGRRFAEELSAIDLRNPQGCFRGPQLIAGAVDESPKRDDSGALIAASRQSGSPVTTPPDKVGVFWSGNALYEGFRPLSLYQATRHWLEGLGP